MLYCSNSKGRLMEPEQRKDRHAPDRQAADRSDLPAEQAAFTVPFASEGLESLRDSRC
ncbi:hypothetical protein PMI42_05841 [Bradyrhizobium sp. YR681]|nr:hypothetical protein PMI42_05841 [Bradyrhizobium sp. YR681]